MPDVSNEWRETGVEMPEKNLHPGSRARSEMIGRFMVPDGGTMHDQLEVARIHLLNQI